MDKKINLKLIKKYFFFLLTSLIFWTLLAILKNKEVFSYLLSAVYGFIAFAIPEIIYFYYLKRRNNNKITAGLVVYDAIYALILKYFVLIIILGICFKFLNLVNLVVVFSFVLTIFFKIFLYILFPNSKF